MNLYNQTMFISRNVRKCTFWNTEANQPAHMPHSDQSLCCSHNETLYPWLTKMRPGNILIHILLAEIQLSLRECAGWSKSPLSAYVRKVRFLTLRVRMCSKLSNTCRFISGMSANTNHSWFRKTVLVVLQLKRWQKTISNTSFPMISFLTMRCQNHVLMTSFIWNVTCWCHMTTKIRDGHSRPGCQWLEHIAWPYMAG